MFERTVFARRAIGIRFGICASGDDFAREFCSPAVTGVSAANTVSYAYDLAGKVTGITDSLGNSLSNSYDIAGRLTGESETVPGLSAKAVAYQYGPAVTSIASL